MKETFLGIPNIDVYLVMSILVFFILLEVIAGYWHRSKRNGSDWIQELGSFLVLSLATKPFIVILVILLGNTFLPQYQYAFHEVNFFFLLLFYILNDDLLQYWYHRSAHEYPFLWKLHRTHHQAEEMGFFVSYRNAAIYYLLMPNIWWVGVFTFLGGAKAVAVGLVLKQLIVISSHSTLSYDKFLYKNKFLKPLATIIERIFITPAFHHAHHGQSKLDGISDPNSNFGNMFSIWDQLFGTAVFTRQFPEKYGLMDDPKEPWTATILYPIVASDNPASELSRGFQKKDTRSKEPITIQLEKGQKYLWCACGYSQNQPFCDGSHQGTKKKPVLFEAKRTGSVRLCNCKMTKISPFCDESHVDFPISIPK